MRLVVSDNEVGYVHVWKYPKGNVSAYFVRKTSTNGGYWENQGLRQCTFAEFREMFPYRLSTPFSRTKDKKQRY